MCHRLPTTSAVSPLTSNAAVRRSPAPTGGPALLIALAFLALASCTASTPDHSSLEDDAGESANLEAGSADSSEADASSGDGSDNTVNVPDSGAARNACADSKTQESCDECCTSQYPAGRRAYQATSISILCREENCQEACTNTYCASPPTGPDATCRSCWNEVLPRNTSEFFETCRADADCAEYSACLDANCITKPK